MQYDKDVIEIFYNAILNGYSVFFAQEPLLAKHIAPADVFRVNCALAGVKEKFQAAGLASEYEILKDLATKGVWTHRDEAAIAGFESQLKKKRQVRELVFLKNDIRRVDDEIAKINKELSEVRNKRYTLLINSLEQRIESEKRDLFVFCCVLTPAKKPFWKSRKKFEDEDSSTFRVVSDGFYNTLREINSSILRAVARTDDARFRFKHCPLSLLADTSNFLLELRQWCSFYDSVYACDDRPSEEIIVDDDRLDDWVRARKKQQEESTKSVNSKEGFTSYPGASKDDMETLGGVDKDTLLKVAKNG